MKTSTFFSRLFFLTTVFFITTAAHVTAQNYEVYDGDEFSVMFTVRNSVAENVKFAPTGATEWTDFKVIDTKNWYGKSNMEGCLFTFYVKDGKNKNFQVDYYEDGYIWVFSIDANKRQNGDGWQLWMRD